MSIGNYIKAAIFIVACAGLYMSLGPSRSESYIRARSVRLIGEHNMCSGEQIKAPSGENYILSAAHCTVTAKNGEILIQTEDGRKLRRRIIAEDANSDLLLLEGVPGLEGLPIARWIGPTAHIRTFTHGSNMDTYETSGVIIETKHIEIAIEEIVDQAGEDACKAMPKNKVVDDQTFFGPIKICVLSVEETATTASIVPGSSGGMAVDRDGSVVGVASCTDGFFGYLVPLEDIRVFLANY